MDKFDAVIKKDILKISHCPAVPSRNLNQPRTDFISFEISFDNFWKFLQEIRTINTTLPIQCTIYDEAMIKNNKSDLSMRYYFLKQIMNLNFLRIDFKLSESTFPVYNAIMDRLNWKHDKVSFLDMTVDRKPTEIKNLKLYQARGKILLPEEKLLWESDYVLKTLIGKVDRSVLEDTDKLKYVVRHFIDGLSRHYDIDQLTDYDKVFLAYHFIKDGNQLNITFANERTFYGMDGKQHLNASEDHWESRPYGTYIRRKGVCEGQARLFRVLLNNWDFEVNATTINGQSPLGPHCWLGVEIDDKLFYCCTTQGGLFSESNFIADSKEYYPQIYTRSALSQEDLKKIESHVRSLKR